MNEGKESLTVSEGEEDVRKWPCVMVDIETLGTGERAAILEIGAVCFDLATGEMGHEFEVKLLLSDCVAEGQVIDAETLCWWMERWRLGSSPVPDLTDARERTGLREGLLAFADWWRSVATEDAQLWCRGNLDAKVLEAAFGEVCGCPWRYSQVRDQRTALDWEGIVPRREDVTHSAIEDARQQARDLIFAAEWRGEVEWNGREAFQQITELLGMPWEARKDVVAQVRWLKTNLEILKGRGWVSWPRDFDGAEAEREPVMDEKGGEG